MPRYVAMFRRSNKEKYWTVHGATWDELQNLLHMILTLTLERNLEVHIKCIMETVE